MSDSAELAVRTPDGATRVIPLSSRCVSLGRAAENDLSFPEQQELSRRHLVLERGPDGWLVRDLGSRNGTFLNGSAVREPRLLRPGDRITAGKLALEFHMGGAARQTSAEAGGGATIAIRLDGLLTPAAAGPYQNALPLSSTRHLRALMHAGAEFAGRMPLAQLLPLILDLAATAVQAPRGVLMLEENGALEERAVRGSRFHISTTARDRVLHGRESLLIEDMEREESLRLQASIIAQRVRSVLAAPLQTRDRVLGLIYLDSAGQARAFTREDLNLITVMANMAAVAIENARLAEVEERERRVSLEMEQAAAIQRALLPPAPPCVPGLDIAAFSQSCHQAGGDYYDFFGLPGGRLAVLVGDIAGKGMPAALLMAGLQAHVQVLMEAAEEPSRLVERLNRVTAAHCPGNRFVTLFYAEIDPASGALEYVNAGHNPPLLLHRNGTVERLATGGLLLGVFRDAAYEAGHAWLAEGETLVLYSDGVTEAVRRGDGEEFGEARLAGVLAEAADATAGQMVERVRDGVAGFAGGVSTADDFTLLILRRMAAA
ncbi:MAG: SpoIIE family protein phosphatase [Bryobacteraceae bacterium]|nr:SpoIIE family protein phosphatase [Bryobacteraceae bacterium]